MARGLHLLYGERVMEVLVVYQIGEGKGEHLMLVAMGALCMGLTPVLHIWL